MSRTTLVHTTVALAFVLSVPAHAGTLKCPPDSVKVGNVCIDKYEASVWQVPALHHDQQFAVAEGDASMWGTPALVHRRLGQGSFRVLVTDTYERRCAITREKALPVLQAAHIRPVTKAGQHRVDNGILLRSDVHTLFDQGYLTVTPDHCVRVSRRLKKDFDNGEHYYQLDGSDTGDYTRRSKS